MLQIRTDNIALETQIGAVGFAVVTDQAVAVGVTALPTPITDLASDMFFLHQFLLARTVFATAIGFEAPGGTVIQVDNKAMRKVNDDQDLVITTEGLSDGFIIDIAGRFLVKES